MPLPESWGPLRGVGATIEHLSGVESPILENTLFPVVQWHPVLAFGLTASERYGQPRKGILELDRLRHSQKTT